MQMKLLCGLPLRESGSLGTRMLRNGSPVRLVWLTLLLGSLLASSASAQSQQPSSSPSVQENAQPATRASGTATRYHPSVSRRAVQYYSMIWGVDSLEVKWTESGEVIRFTYRVIDPVKAAVLNDKKNQPSLIDPQAGVKLMVPSLEKVGQLRQSSTPEAGKSYWMAFSNKGRYVKKGHHVDVEIGNFRAQGLVVN
jgi:hypothetical protein